MSLTFRYTSILWLVQPENEKPVVESREEEISDEKLRQKAQYLYHQDCEGDQRKLNLVPLFPFAYDYNY